MKSEPGHSFLIRAILAGIITAFIICAGCIQHSPTSGTVAPQPQHLTIRVRTPLTNAMATTAIPSPSLFTTKPSPAGNSQSAGSLAIWSSPPACSVYIDGMYAGDTPAVRGSFTKSLAGGPHTIRISKIGYEDLVRDVFIDSGETVIVTATLREKPFPYYTINPASSFSRSLS